MVQEFFLIKQINVCMPTDQWIIPLGRPWTGMLHNLATSSRL